MVIKLRHLTGFLLLYCMLHPAISAAKQVDRFFAAGTLQTASYCIYAIDADTGEKICETPQKSLSSASVMKLFTTAVALEVLGPDYSFLTSFGYTGNIDPQTGTLKGDLYIKGGADPAFCSSYFTDHYKNCFDNWIGQLKKSGIKKVSGRLLLDLSASEQAPVPGGWAWDDIGNYYGAGVSALTFQDNLYEIHFTSPKAEGKPAAVASIRPEIEGLALENKVLSSTRPGDHTIVYGAPGSLSQYIEGTVPVDQSDFIVRAAMPDPPLTAGQIFVKKLKENGISLSGPVVKVTQLPGGPGTQLAAQLSPTLKDLIVPLNKESLNLFAEHLLREIGRRSSGEASAEKGLEAYLQFCKTKGINTEGFFPEDGSGLTRSNSFTARTLVETIQSVYDSKNREIFFNSLPIAGVDGTLRNSFKGTPLEKNVKAKTGSMARVRSIAGQMKSRSGRTLLFAVLINNFDLTSQEMSKLLESILLSLYDGDVSLKN